MRSPRAPFLPPRVLIIVVIAALGAACGAPSPPPEPAPAAPPASSAPSSSAPPPADRELFRDVAADSGLDFVHWNGMTGEYFYAEMMGAGAALLDYDGDGDLDVYLVQGNPLDPARPPLVAPPGPLPLSDRLFRNDPADGSTAAGLRFTDVTEASGLAATGYGMGVAAADFDNDGWVDLYLANLGPNQHWRNNGDGTFSDVTDAATGERRWSVAIAVLDYDRDGWLDLYVGNYVVFSPASNPRCQDELGTPNYCGPLSFPPETDTLLHNRGDGTFEDVSTQAGIRREHGGALGVAAADFDRDGWIDVYVGNDGLPNQLWINRHDGTFENRALLGGCAVDVQGNPQASMGMAAADFDGDGDEDLAIANLTKELNTFYRNAGDASFEDRSAESGLGAPSWGMTGFGVGAFDFDDDGALDLMVVNGAVKVIKEQALAGEILPLAQRNQLFHNRGDGRFEDVTDRAGAVFARVEVSRGAAFGDLDDDGDVDVVLTNNNGPARLLLGQGTGGRHWLGLRLVTGAPGRERDAIGAEALVELASGRRLLRRASTAGGYASSNDPRVHFGLGSETGVAGVEVRWPDGRRERWSGLAIDAYTTLRQGSGE